MNEELSQLADDYFQNSLNSSPTSAIMRGYKEYFDQIEELTETKFDQNLGDLDKFEKRLIEIDFDNLSKKEKVTHGMLEYAFASNKDSLHDRSWEFGAGVSGFTGYLIDYNQQMFVPEDINFCIRLMALVQLKSDRQPLHPYLNESSKLRPDRC